MENMLRKIHQKPEKINKAIRIYRDDSIYKNENMLGLYIINCFQSRIESSIRKKLGHVDDVLVGEIMSEILCKWVKKDDVKNYYNYICSNIHYYSKNYIDLNYFYLGLTHSQIKSFQRLIRKLKNDITLNEKEKKLYDKYDSIRMKTVNLDSCVVVKEDDYVEYLI